VEALIEATNWQKLIQETAAHHAQLIAVSKTKSNAAIQALYDLGQRDFGENYVQEFVSKQASLPKDICWHFIGHLQRNKVKQIVGIATVIHGVDSERLLQEINKEAAKKNCVQAVLLQYFIAQEETKFGLDAAEIEAIIAQKEQYAHVRFLGLMGMATHTTDEHQIKKEFEQVMQLKQHLKALYFKEATAFSMASIGMSGDYSIALAVGATHIRIGSMLFGARTYPS
jgi:pyridoxal phosphate enzyme (YggS family)